MTFGKFQADEQGWVDTIKSVKVGGIVRMNTMDWLGQSQYGTQTVYWPSLSSAISEVFILRIQHGSRKNLNPLFFKKIFLRFISNEQQGSDLTKV